MHKFYYKLISNSCAAHPGVRVTKYNNARCFNHVKIAEGNNILNNTLLHCQFKLHRYDKDDVVLEDL